MSQYRFSRRAYLATLGSMVAGSAGCIAPSKSPSNPSANRTTRKQTSKNPEISLSGGAAWTTAGYDSGHSGFNPDAVGPDTDPEIVWDSGVSGIYTLREPAVAGGRVYISSNELVWAFDAETGGRAWQTHLGGMTHHFSPTYENNALYAVSKQAAGTNNEAAGAVSALNPTDGSETWRTSLPATSTIALGSGRVYVAAKADGQGHVLALDSSDGDTRWRFDVPAADTSYVTGTPAYSNGTVFVAATHVSEDGQTSGVLYALDAETGTVDWTVDTTEALPVAPVVTDNRVFVAARGGTVHAVSPDGSTEWTRDTGAQIYSRPVYAGGRLFVLTAADIVAIGADGDELWRAASVRNQMAGMSVAGNTLYVGGEPLFALDTTDGSVLFELPVDVYHGSYGAPVVVDDVLYAGICIKKEAGAEYDNSVRAYV